jgi:hypothetical protein
MPKKLVNEHTVLLNEMQINYFNLHEQSLQKILMQMAQTNSSLTSIKNYDEMNPHSKNV